MKIRPPSDLERLGVFVGSMLVTRAAIAFANRPSHLDVRDNGLTLAVYRPPNQTVHRAGWVWSRQETGWLFSFGTRTVGVAIGWNRPLSGDLPAGWVDVGFLTDHSGFSFQEGTEDWAREALDLVDEAQVAEWRKRYGADNPEVN